MRVAAVQLTAGADLERNLEQAVQAVRDAAARGAGLVVLPEKWLAIGEPAVIHEAAARYGEQLPSLLGELSRSLQIDLIAGSVPELAGDDPRPFNTSLHLRPDGTVAARYRKVHLFDADVAGISYRESAGERAGQTAVLTRLSDGAAVGMTICFDLRFGELFGVLAQSGAQVFVVPAAFTLATTRAHWEPLLRARAIEHGCFVVAANQAGQHADGTQSGGQSMVISPWGEVLARAGEEGSAILLADCDLAAVEQAREALPVHRLRRPEVYRPVDGRDGEDLPSGAVASD